MKLASLLIKTGYSVRIGREPVAGAEGKRNAQQQYYVEYWEE
ncbi:hypothetical protein OBO34_19405 [Clostridiales Family XIII bacterium ASD5510]|uniref:Uncharacterized protein n=2 Tax=Bacteria TaxID=2 RepID=A0A9J6QY94_9FIRM|nr:hypothetical protein [Hominibacterium faecale]MCU7380483.1 hypothetical protein [Hominibacterium faecale]